MNVKDWRKPVYLSKLSAKVNDRGTVEYQIPVYYGDVNFVVATADYEIASYGKEGEELIKVVVTKYNKAFNELVSPGDLLHLNEVDTQPHEVISVRVGNMAKTIYARKKMRYA